MSEQEAAAAPAAPKMVVDPKTGEKISKNELKRRMKAEKAAAAKAEKAAKKAAAAKANPAKKKATVEEDPVDPTAYRANRQAAIEALPQGASFPHKFNVTVRLPAFIEKYADAMEAGEQLKDVTVSVAGRVHSKRASGAKLHFYDLRGEGAKIQVMSSIGDYENDGDDEAYAKIHARLRRGDIIGVTGHPGKSRKGELSIFPTKITLLSPCMHMLPKEQQGLNQDTRYRQRYLDLIVTPSTRDVFYTRAKIVDFVRDFLRERDFLEVETPMMNMIAGGATAKPFVTYHNDLHMDLYMRVAPELYLKKLVIGGLDRVFEIGKQFRNESIDLTHNPEFTSCEFYQAYADYHDLMDMSELMFSSMVKSITGSYDLTIEREPGKVVTVNFEPPFQRIPMVKTIEEATNTKIPIEDPEKCLPIVEALCKKYDLECTPPRTTARLLDKLVAHFIEDNEELWKKPFFIIDHPEIMSPLAKYHRDTPGLTERFELFLCGTEICNAYTELNNPMVQRERFIEQSRQAAEGDDEAQPYDESFCTAMEYALPPTGGWGAGIDRLAMFLTNRFNIKEVLLFPAMKPDDQPSAATKVVEGEVAQGVENLSVDSDATIKALLAEVQAELKDNLFLKGKTPTHHDAGVYAKLLKTASGDNAKIKTSFERLSDDATFAKSHAQALQWAHLMGLFPNEERLKWA